MDENMLYEYNYEKPELSETYLEHHGVQGQKWGVRNGPPYPLSRQKKGNGRLASGKGSIKKRKPSGGLIERYKAKKTYKQRVQSAEKARQAKQTKAEEAKRAQEEQDRREAEALNEEMWRQDVIRRGDAETAAKNTDKFSEAEINAIISRYQTNQRLSQLVADANPKIEDLPEAKKTVFEKMGNAVNEINKFAGPASQLAKNASSIYDLYTKVNTEKDREAKEELNRKQTLANIEQTRAATKSGLERSKAETEQIKANTENIKKGIFAPNNQQQNQQQNQQKQNNEQSNNKLKPFKDIDKETSKILEKAGKEKNAKPGDSMLYNGKRYSYDGKKWMENPNSFTVDKSMIVEKVGPTHDQKSKLSDAQKSSIAKLNDAADSARLLGDEKRSKALKNQAKEVESGKLSPQKIDLNKPGWSKDITFKDEVKAAKQKWDETSTYRENSKKQLESSKQIAKQRASNAASKILSNPNSQGAISQLIKDATKNTKTTSGKPLKLNTDWLANQSTDALRLMKLNIDNTRNDSSAQLLNDINKILKKRGAASPFR